MGGVDFHRSFKVEDNSDYNLHITLKIDRCSVDPKKEETEPFLV